MLTFMLHLQYKGKNYKIIILFYLKNIKIIFYKLGKGIPNSRVGEFLIKAGNLWKSIGNKKLEYQELVSQLHSYILQEYSYNASYLQNSNIPLKW